MWFRGLKQLDLPKLEEEVLDFWEKNRIFERSLKQREGRKTFRFYEGPPYANGLPGIHHVLSRIFKDVVLRYKAMSGYLVPRRAGWDTHGLPIELAAEKELGIKTKKEIEKIGIGVFNRKARELIFIYKDKWEAFTRRIGYWLDLKNAYVTYANDYIESLWWVFKKISDRGYLKEFRKVVPYCPRCQTPLSSHEMGQPGVYQSTDDPSIYVKFRLADAKNEYLLVWTTTPWTLPANVAIAVLPGVTYTKYRVGKDYLWSHNPPPRLPQKAEVAEKLSGQKLIGRPYLPLYQPKNYQPQAGDFEVRAADFVKTDEGTGLVHISPAFGEEDFGLIGRDNFPVTIDDEGRMAEGLPGAGKFIKQADQDIMKDLEKRGLLYAAETLHHEYPFCWRCGTPVIYFARKSWFFEVSRLRQRLVAENKKINWIPAYIKEGRFGEWIKNAADWAISRERYWGTPLPIWRCAEGHLRVIGSLEELDRYAYSANVFFLLRHGEAEHNLADLIAAGPETEGRISRLTAKGKEEARLAAKELASKGIDIIFTSPYERAYQTAKIVADFIGAEVVKDKRLGELDTGIFNWKKIEEHKAFFSHPLEEFTKRPPGGESLIDLKRRLVSFLKEINSRYRRRRILVVSHGDPLWLIEVIAAGAANEEAFRFSYPALGRWREIKLRNWPLNEEGEVDLHRPYIDEIYLACDRCDKPMSRIPDVADVWFDSGAMPWASVHYPFENKKLIEKGIAYPADYIAEAIDQTRGWFYTLLASAVLLGAKAPYKNVISLGLINDKYGQKMSKSKGNVIEPDEVINQYGVDAVRWYFYTINPPGEAKNFDEAEVALVVRRFFLLLYHSFKFYEMMQSNFAASRSEEGRKQHLLDRWILARLNETIAGVTRDFEIYEIGNAARQIEALVDDLSRWYIRRSRERPAMTATLGLVLLEISKLIAPFAPFFAEALYQAVARTGGFQVKPSVHLEDWPKKRRGWQDSKLIEKMEATRRLAAAVLAERSAAGIKVRQPLGLLKIKAEILKKEKEFWQILAEEVNVKEVIWDETITGEVWLDTRLTPVLVEEGRVRELIRLIQNLRKETALEPRHRIDLYLQIPETMRPALGRWLDFLGQEVGAREIYFKATKKFDAELAVKIEGREIWLAIKKAD